MSVSQLSVSSETGGKQAPDAASSAVPSWVERPWAHDVFVSFDGPTKNIIGASVKCWG